MNNLKFGVLACGLLGLIGCFIPEHGASFFASRAAPAEVGGGVHVYMVMAGYLAALVMGAMASAKPPMQRWHSIVAVVGFAFVLFKFRSLITLVLKHGGLGGRMMMVAAIVGLILAAITIAKPETAK